MKHDYTHITVILDRTGSMQTIRDDTIGGFNTFLEQQKIEPGMATLTLQTGHYRRGRKNKIGFDPADRQPPDDPKKQKA